MSAVSMRSTPSSRARRRTRGASSGSLTIRMAPKPRRRTSSSPPRRQAHPTPPRSVSEALDHPPRHVQRLLSRREPAGGDRDPVVDRPEQQLGAEFPLGVEDRMRDDPPAPTYEPPDRDRGAGPRRDLAPEQPRAERLHLQPRGDRDRHRRPARARREQAERRARTWLHVELSRMPDPL